LATTLAARTPTRTANFTRFAWGVLAWNVLVVLWGAFVRASGSGAGCGSHWPLCNGEVVPVAPRIETIIEFTHRMMSGAAAVAVVVLWLWSLRGFLRGDRARKMALASVVFIVVEIVLGAGLVLFHYVDKNQSIGRVVSLSLHLVNTLLLLASLALTAWFSRGAIQIIRRQSRLVLAALPIAILVSVTGAIAALGDTLFPVTSLAEGFRQDLAGAASLLVRLRLLHPAFAILGAVYIAGTSITVLRARHSRLAICVLVLALAQLAAGAINVLLLAPVWMQITHLLLADSLWIALVLLAVES